MKREPKDYEHWDAEEFKHTKHHDPVWQIIVLIGFCAALALLSLWFACPGGE